MIINFPKRLELSLYWVFELPKAYREENKYERGSKHFSFPSPLPVCYLIVSPTILLPLRVELFLRSSSEWRCSETSESSLPRGSWAWTWSIRSYPRHSHHSLRCSDSYSPKHRRKWAPVARSALLLLSDSCLLFSCVSPLPLPRPLPHPLSLSLPPTSYRKHRAIGVLCNRIHVWLKLSNWLTTVRLEHLVRIEMGQLAVRINWKEDGMRKGGEGRGKQRGEKL